ncbi:arsenate reductase ArsC [Algisphaera agarilytica]|uniref:Arsenate reductase n=1 Tax=Algisphaera agarilytica TaxID=1385975 RepID=A0A7X0H9J9_9BACT|nr:arsenate reductase ArsC [Algisphaera agarilytica]MBB6431617.1 arsenate reductase [Algisphaera agarilytica]
MTHKKRYLVLCTANRCRSQMAHGWLAHLGGDAVEVSSAGAKPGGVHPLSIQVMNEAGVDISGHSSDHLDQYLEDDFDAVITVCDNAKEACPYFPGAKRLIHHAFDDPDDKTGTLTEEQMLPTFHRVRDEIRTWCADFLAEEGVAVAV